MLRFEIKNLFNRKGIMLFVLILLILNGVLVFRASCQVDDYGSTPKQLNDTYAQLPVNNDEKLSWIESQMQTATIAEYQRYDALFDRVSEALNYQSGLSDRISEAEYKLSSGFLTTPGTFDFRSLQMVEREYAPLVSNGITPTIESSLGIELATQTRSSDVLLAFLALAFSLGVIMLPKEEGQWVLLKPLKNGRGNLLATKLGAVFILLSVALVIVYGTDFYIAQVRFGLGALNRPIQSLYHFNTSRFAISVGYYLLLFILYKLLWLFTVGAACFLLCVYMSNSTSVYGALIGLLGLSVLCVQSANPWLKITNLIWMSDATWYYSGYYSLNFFGYPLDAFTISILELSAAFVIACILSFSRFAHEENVPAERKNETIVRPARTHINLFIHEGYKLLIYQKACFVVLALLGLQILLCATKPYDIDNYMRYYTQQLQGMTEENAEEWIVSEQVRFDSIHAQIAQWNQQLQNNTMEQELYQLLIKPLNAELVYEDAFLRTVDQFQAVKSLKQDSPGVAFVEQQVYEKALGSAAQQDNGINAVCLAVALSIGLSDLFAVERSTHMEQLLMTSPRKKLSRRSKIIWGCIFSALSAAVVYLTNIVFMQAKLGFALPSASAGSLLFLPDIFRHVPIWAYMTGVGLLWVFAACFGGAAVMMISQKSKSRTAATLGSGLFLLAVVSILFMM